MNKYYDLCLILLYIFAYTFLISEMKDGDQEKWAGPNGIGHVDASEVLQTTISSSAQSPNAANSSTDAEC